MNIRQLREKLYDLCQQEDSIRAWADKNDVAFSYAAAVIRGDKMPGKSILKAMGLRKSFQEKKNPAVMKFEDITN